MEENVSTKEKEPGFFEKLSRLKSISKKQKAFFISLFAVILTALILLPLTKSRGKSRIPLSFEEGTLFPENLTALNHSSISGKFKEDSYGYYKFTENQREVLSGFYSEKKYISLVLRLKFKSVSVGELLEQSGEEKSFHYGFLYESDFDENDKFTGDAKKRILGTADLRNFITLSKVRKESLADFSIAVEKALERTELPVGFLLYTEVPAVLVSARFEKAKIGFDLTGDVPFFALPSNGGKTGDITGADFTGGTNVFPRSNTESTIMPRILLTIVDEDDFSEKEDFSSEENPSYTGCFTEETDAFDGKNRSSSRKCSLNAGGEVLTIHRFQKEDSFEIQTSMLSNPFSPFSSDGIIKKIIMCENDESLIAKNRKNPLKPLSTDPGLLPVSRKNTWRNPDYELYRWDRFPTVLLFDTKDYEVQSEFFRRLAFYAEKAGFRGRILTDAELGNMHGYNAHDYSAESLASFFTISEPMKDILNEREKLLLKILVENKIIIPEGERLVNGRYIPQKYTSGNGAVISISQESASYQRQSLCAHEAWHGIYFTDEDFRNATAAIFYTIDKRATDFLISYWTSQSSLNYDPNDEYLIKNEFMAYIMQQGLSQIKKYFTRIANYQSVQKAIPDLANYVINSQAIALEDAGKAFESYADSRWGLACGRVSLITR